MSDLGPDIGPDLGPDVQPPQPNSSPFLTPEAAATVQITAYATAGDSSQAGIGSISSQDLACPLVAILSVDSGTITLSTGSHAPSVSVETLAGAVLGSQTNTTCGVGPAQSLKVPFLLNATNPDFVVGSRYIATWTIWLTASEDSVERNVTVVFVFDITP